MEPEAPRRRHTHQRGYAVMRNPSLNKVNRRPAGQPHGLSRSGSGPSRVSLQQGVAPPPAPRTESADVRARGLQGALRASALVAWRGPPGPACAQECDGRVVLVPPHLGILFWDKRRCNLFTVLFGVSSPKQESQAKKSSIRKSVCI